MARGLIYAEGFRPQFSGHETFPLRYGWLKKVYEAIEASVDDPNNKSVFLSEQAIARFGVGKNMVASMRYWALAARTLIDDSKGNFKGPFRSTPIAQRMLSRKMGGIRTWRSRHHCGGCIGSLLPTQLPQRRSTTSSIIVS